MWSDPLIIFGGAFAAALVAGSTGFAFAIIGMAIWLHIMPPTRAVPLVVICSITLNLVLVWRLWGAVQMERLKPFLFGALVGVPLGIAALQKLDATAIRVFVGALVILYSVVMMRRTHMPVLKLAGRTGTALDGLVGMLGGFMGGATSLNGLFPTLWSGLRGWDKREQRGVFQPYILVVHLYTLLWLGGVGNITRQTFSDLLLCLPALAAGGYVGFRYFHRISDQTFRKLILILFLVSGVILCL
ncbi:MAG TPA: sulfite exporter TauE/SafE family protein [Gammaproteobacteria bacterium]|nr:sulfite exporter TauE/SafE family protein [Gammaproteobacteria bacterium]